MPADAPIRLVVNADHFGASAAVCDGILQAHHHGIVTSTSVLGNAADPTALRAALGTAPDLGVGVQIVLCGGAPVSAPGSIPSLVDERGLFPTSPRELLARWAKARLSPVDLEREIDAQLARLLDTGLHLDHINTFLHLGCIPAVAAALTAVARRRNIGCVRTTVEEPNFTWFTDLERGLPLAILGGLSWWSQRSLGTRRHGPRSWGAAESGNLNRMRIIEIFGRLRPGIHELICHPGQAEDAVMTPSGRHRMFDRPGELEALRSPSVRQACVQRSIALCRFGDLF